ncbi:MAG TPA: hypothetical protein VFV89_15980 [Nocardioides sp.]|uniref:hypothetical protein n=1 Tax=Nocardioides sp. TaxID=35761 RepID=UPI002E31905A|nr:hypothetical protein [Nocardioides sp.]HEX5089309.1 hypothetical protein [Nocardioides sp.]
MNKALRRVGSALSPLALLVALLALVASAAGVGYAAGQIGTSDIKNNAITAKKIKKNAVTAKKIKKNAVTADKVKDGSLGAADMVAEEQQHAATLLNGTEGDCIWQGGAALAPGLGGPTYRKDRFGVVHLSGIAVGMNGPGGDAVCDSSAPGQASDAIVFTLPAGYVPAKTMIVGDLSSGGTIIVGAAGLISGPFVLPPGAVAANVAGAPVLLDSVTFDPAGSSVVLPKMAASGRVNGSLARAIGLG